VTVWNRPEVDQWEFESSLDEFLQVRAQNIYPYSFHSDGCSTHAASYVSPYDERFLDACMRHDFGYQNYGRRLEISQNEATKSEVNDQFEVDMRAICDANEEWNQSTCYTAIKIFRLFVETVDSGFSVDQEWRWSPDRCDPGDPPGSCGES
jgi:hypothetical protein